MAARKGLVLSLGFDARGAFDQMVSSFQSKIKQMENAANRANIGDNLGDQFDDLKKQLDDAVKRTQEMYDKIDEGKLDSKAFDAYKEKVTSDFAAIQKQIEGLSTALGSLSGGKVAQNILEGFDQVKREFNELKTLVNDTNSVFNQLAQVSAKYGQNMASAATSSTKSIREIQRAYNKVIKKDFATMEQGFGKTYGKYLRTEPGEQDLMIASWTDDDQRRKFEQEFNERVREITELKKLYVAANEERLKLKGKEDTEEWFVAITKRAEAMKNLIDAYNKLTPLENIKIATDSKYTGVEPLDWLNSDKSKDGRKLSKERVQIFKDQYADIQKQIAQYLDSVDPQQVTASMFEFKDGAIKIPVDLDLIHGTNTLKNKIRQQVGEMQKIVDANPLEIPIALRGVKIKGQGATKELLKKYGLDFSEAKDAVDKNAKNLTGQMAQAIGNEKIETPKIDLGDQYARAYMDSLHFATEALKLEIAKMKQMFVEDGKPIKIPIDFDYQQAVETVRTALSEVGKDKEGNAIHLFDNLNVPEEMSGKLAEAGKTAASSWQTAMISSIGSVASAFQSAMGKGLQLDSGLLKGQLNSIKNQLSMALGHISPSEQNQATINKSIQASFAKAYNTVQQDASKGRLLDDQLGTHDFNLSARNGYMHYFEEVFQQLQKLQQAGGSAVTALGQVFKLSGVSESDAVAIVDLFKAFSTENPIPNNLVVGINAIVKSLKQLQGIMTGISQTMVSIDSAMPADGAFGINPQALDSVINKIQQMIDLFRQANGVFTEQEIDAQFQKVREAFSNIDTQWLAQFNKDRTIPQSLKKYFDDFQKQYQKYIGMGGTEDQLTPTSLVTNAFKERERATITSYFLDNWRETKNQIETETPQLQQEMNSVIGEGVGTAGVDAANEWKSAMIAAIQEVKNALQSMFKFQSDNKIYEFLKGWRDADTMQKTYRRNGKSHEISMSELFYKDKNGNIVSLPKDENPAHGALERAAFYNSKTGEISNTYTVDQKGSTGMQNAIEKFSGSVEKFDTALHSHPIEQGQAHGYKSIGHNLGFSKADIQSYVGDQEGKYGYWMRDGIKKLAVQSNGMINQLDLSSFSRDIQLRIRDLYIEKLKQAGEAWQAATDRKNKVFDYDKRDEVGYHKYMQEAITQALIQDAKKNGKTITPQAIDTSKYYRQFSIEEFNKPIAEDGAVYIQALAESIQNISVAMSELNAKGGFDFKIDTSSLENLDTHLQNIVSSLQAIKQNFQLAFADIGNINPQKIDLFSVFDKQYAKFKKTTEEDAMPNLLINENAQQYFSDTFRSIQKYQAFKPNANIDQLINNLIRNRIVDPKDFKSAYQTFNSNNPIPANIPKALRGVLDQINELPTALGGEKGNVLGISSADIQQITTQFQSLADVLQQFNNADNSGLSDSINKLVLAFGSFDAQKLSIDPQAFSEINTQLQNMLHLMEQISGVYSQKTIDGQWLNIQDKFAKLTEVAPHLNLKTQKKELEDFAAEYQKYLNMGGTQTYTDLTTDKTTLQKLSKILPSGAEEKPIEESKVNITSNAKAVGEELAQLQQKLIEITGKDYEIKLTIPSSQDFTNNITTLLDSISDADKIKALENTLNTLADTLERINGYKNTGNIFKGLKLTEANMAALDTLPEKIGAIRDSLQKFPTNASSFFKGISDILSNAKALENLVTALKAKKKDLDAITGAASGTGKPKTDAQRSNEIYTALSSAYTDVLKKTKSMSKWGLDEQQKKAIQDAINKDYEQIKQYEDQITNDQTLYNTGKNEKIRILQQEIKLQEELARIRNEARDDKESERLGALADKYFEMSEALTKDSEGWKGAIDALKKAGVYDELGDITKIDRRIRRDEKTDEYYISYRAQDAEGNNRTVGHNGDLLIDNRIAANSGQVYKDVTQHLQNILKLRTQLAGLDKNEQPRAYANVTEQIKAEEDALAEIKSQALEIQELVPNIMAKIGELEAEWGKKTSDSVRYSLDNAKDSISATFKNIDKDYGETLKGAPDIQKQLQSLRLRANGATDKTELNQINEQVLRLKENLESLSEIDAKHSGWMTMVDSFGDLSGVEQWSTALDAVLDKIAEYEALVSKLRAGGKLSLDETSRRGQLETDITSELGRIKTKTSPDQLNELDQVKELRARAKDIMKEMASLNIENAITGWDENRTPTIIARLEQLDQRLQQVKADAAALDATVPGMTDEINKMQMEYNEITQKGIEDSVSNMQQKLTADLEKLRAGFGDLASEGSISDRFTAIETAISGITTKNDIPAIAQQIRDLASALKELDAGKIKTAGWTNALNNLDPKGKVQKFVEDIDAVKQKIREYQDLINKKASGQTLTDEEKYRVKDLQKQVTRQISALQKNTGGRYNISNKYGSQRNFDNVDQIQQYYKSLSDVDAASMKITTSNNRVSASFTKLNGDVVNSTMAFDAEMGVWREVQSVTTQTANIFDRIGMSLKKSASYFRSYFSGYMVAQKMIAGIRGAINTIKDLDAQFTEMQKVSQDSYSSLRQYADGAYEVAQKLGSTTSDVLNSTADFLRIGQSIEQAGKSAQTAAILKNVSQYENISDATDSLIAMEQAYQDVDPMSIVDKLNLVGDRFAISTDELADGMKNAGSTLSLLGNSIDDTAALLTSANTVIQDISKVSSGMRTIALRVVGTEEGKAKLEEDGEDTGDYVIETKAKKRAKIKKYTATASNKQGVDILDQNGNYKTTYEYMKEISKVYKQIQAEDKKFGTNRAVALIEELAGKTRSNIAAAILANPELLEQVKDVSLDSAGSALREQQIQLESIEGRMATFKAHAEEFWTSFIDTDVVKSVISFGSDVLDVITDLIKSVPSLTTAFSALMAVFSTKGNWGLLNFDRNKGFSSPILQSFKPYQITEGTNKALEALTNMQSSQEGMKQFYTLRANQDGAINSWLAEFGNADQRLGSFIANSENAGQAVENFNAKVANSRPIVTGFQGLMSSLNNVLGNFVSGMVNFGVAMAASMAVKGLVSLVDYLVVTEEELKKAGEAAQDTIKGVRKDIKGQSDLLKDLEESDFNKLVGGVDTKTNKNINLTDEQYEEYLTTCNKIADIFPQVVASYDAQGNAILNLGSSAESATSQLQALLETHRAIAAEKIAENLQDEYMGIQAEAEGGAGEGGVAKKIRDQQEAIMQAQSTIDKANRATNGLFPGKKGGRKEFVHFLRSKLSPDSSDADGVIDLSGYSKTVYETLLSALTKEGVNDTWRKEDKWEDSFQKIGIDLSKMTEEKIQNIIDSVVNPTWEEIDAEELQSAYSAQAEHSQKKSLYEKELEGIYSRMIPDIQASIENNPVFKDLNQGVQAKILEAIGNIDLSKLPEDVKTGQKDIYDYIKQTYLQPVALAFMDFDSDSKTIKQAKQSAKNAITEIFSIDPQEITGEEYQNIIKNQLPTIEDYFNTIYTDKKQAEQKYTDFLQSTGLKSGENPIIGGILDTLGLKGQDRDAAYNQIKELTVSQIRAVEEIINDPKYGGTLQSAIKQATETAKTESVTLSDILGIKDQDNSIVSQASALKQAASAIDTYKESINGGEFTRSDFSKLIEDYPQLAKDTELLNDVMNSFNTSGFLEETDSLNDALDNIKLGKLEDFRKKFAEEYSLIEDEGQKRAAQNYYQSVISGIVPKNMSDQATRKYLSKVGKATGAIGQAGYNGRPDTEKYSLLMKTIGTQFGNEAVLRILADPSLAEMSVEQLVQQIQDTKAEIQVEVNEQAVKNSISLIQNLGSGNKSVKDFETNLQSGTATFDDFLGILSDYPQIVGSAEDSISDLVNTMDFSGRLDDIQGIQQIFGKIKVDNLQGTINQILGNQNLNPQQKTLMRQMAFANTDISGIPARDAANIVKTYAAGNIELTKMATSQNDLERQAAAVAAGMGVSFEKAYEIVQDRAKQATVSAVQSFQSMADEISSFNEKVTSKQATSKDVLGLLETFPELLSQTDVLSSAFSQLTLNGVVSDASTLQALLESISQIRLKELLDSNGITDPNVIMGLANTLDFSHTDRVKAGLTLNRLKEAGIDVSGIDINTEEGLDILGHIQFVIENAEGEKVQDVVDNAVSNGAKKGIQKAISQVSNLSKDMSTLSGMSESITSGQFTIDDVASLEQSFADLNISGEQLNAIYSSLNMEGFVQDAKTANSIVNNLKMDKLKEFFQNTEGLSGGAMQAILGSTRLSGITKKQGEKAAESLTKRFGEYAGDIQRLVEAGDYDALVRLNLITKYDGETDFSTALQNSVEASAKDQNFEFQTNLEVLTNLSTKGDNINDFIDQVSTGEATVDGLLSLIQEVPQIALNSGDALAKMVQSADFDGVIQSIDGLSEAANAFTLQNLQEQFSRIDKVTKNKQLRNALKDYMVDQTDLSGTSRMQAVNALWNMDNKDIRDRVMQGFRKGEFSAEAIMKVFLRGDIDDSDVMAELENEQAKISRKRLSASVQAEINLHSDYSSLNDLSASLANNEATPDDILNLMNSMPEFLNEIEALGISIADMDSDGLVDNAESIQTAINKTKLTNLEKFLSNKNVSNSQKMSNIINTSLDNINAADRQIHNSALYDLLQGKNYTAGAAFKADLMIDNGLIGDDTRTIQAVLDSLDTNVQINTEVKNLQKTISGLQTLDTAISEFNESGTVSAETVQALEQAGIGYNEVLFESESGIKVNTEAANALHDSMAETGIAMSRMITEKSISAMRQNRDRMNEIIDTYNEAHDETLSLSDVLSDAATYGEEFSEVFQLNEANSSIAQATNNLQNMEAELRNSIDLFTKFQEAQSSANPSDNYNTVTGAMQTAKKLWDQGWVGKDDFKSFAQLIAPQGTDVQQAVRDFEANYEHVKGYLTEDTSGLWKFLDDAKAKGFFKDTDDGMEMMIDNLDDFAKEMGISTSLAEQFFFAMKDMNFDVDFSSLTDGYREQLAELSGNMDEANAGQQIQNAIDKFFTFSQAGEDVRESLDPLVAAMNEFKKLHPEQDIQPWIDSLNSLGLLNGFTISVNEDGSLSYTTAELEQTVALIKEIRGQDPATVEVGVQVTDEQKGQIERLLRTEEGRQALIDVGFEVNENTKFDDIVNQLTDPNHPLQIPVEFKPVDTSTTTSQGLVSDSGIAEHEKRKGQLALSGSTQTTATQPEPIVTQFKLAGVDEAKRQLTDLQLQGEKTIRKKVVLEQQEAGNSSSGSSKPDVDTGTQGQRGFKDSSVKTTVGADTGQIDEAQKKVDKLNSTKIGNKSFRVNAINLTAVMNNLTTVNNTQLENKSFSVLCPGLPTVMSQITTIANKISQLDGKVANASVNVKVNKSGGSVPPVLGTAFTLGSAYASGTASASSRDFTVGKNETAIVNEIGQQSRIHNGRWELLPGGPHLQKLDRNDIIFNAAQTKDLIESGRTARKGIPVSPSAYARGTARDLVGEEGIEMYIDPHKGKWQTVGEVGPEFINLPKDAVVFNHDQTTDLLNKGYTNTRATLAHADGTLGDIDLSDEDFIYDPSVESDAGNAFLKGNAFIDPNAQQVRVKISDQGGKKFTKKVGSSSGDDTKAKDGNTKATQNNTKATNDNTKKKKEEGQVFDWIASRLSYLADQTSKFADAITDFVSYSDKMVNLIGKIDKNGKTINATDSYNRSRKGQLSSILQEIAETRQGANRYWDEAKNVKAPYSKNTKKKSQKSANKKFAETKKMIDAGYVINIETIKDSNLATAISNYQQYADSARQAANNVQNLQRSLIELYSTWAKAPAEEAEKQIERLTKGLQGLEAAQARLDALGKGGSTQSILDRLLGKGEGTGSQYRNLGGAGFTAFAQDNANKTSYYKKAWQESKKALQRLRDNYTDYINYESNRLYGQPAIVNVGAVSSSTGTSTKTVSKKTTTKKRTVSKKSLKSTGKSLAKKYKSKLSKKQQTALKKGNKVSLGNTKGKLRTKLKDYNKQVTEYQSYDSADTTGTITKKQVKKAGKAVAKKYSKPLTKKQQKRLEKGKTVKLSKKQKKNTKLKEAVKKQNNLVKARKAQQAAIKSGKAIAKKYAKTLTKQQQNDLKAGKSITLTKDQKKNKKLAAAIKKHNASVKTATTATEKSAKITAKKQATPASDVVGEYKQGKQIFDDAVAEAQADAVAKAAEYAAQKVQEIRDNFDYLTEAYETQLKYQESVNKLAEQNIADAETFGDQIKAADRDLQENNLAINKQLKEQEASNLQKILDAGVKNGTIQENSKEWLEMTEQINAAKSAAHDYAVQIKQTEIKKLEDIVNHYSKIIDQMESILSLTNAMKGYDFDDAVNNYKQASYYADNISAKEKIAGEKWEEASKEQVAFWQMAGGEGSAFEVGSDSYIQKQAEINKLWKEAYDARADVAKLNAEQIQYEIEQWTREIDRQDKFIDNLNTIGGLMNDAAKWNYDTGDLTEQGQMSMVIDKESYTNAVNDLQSINEEREKLQKKFREDANYGQHAYDEDLENLVSRQMSALNSAKSALESFTKTVETTAQKQLEALNKVINKRKEALQKQKEMHDYDRQLKNSNKEIALLEAQSRALEGVADAESKAMKARIDAQIQQKREALQDTTRDHAVSLQTQGLSDLQEKLQENYERWSQEFEANAQKQLDVMKSTNMSTTQLNAQMTQLLSTYGTNMSQLNITTGQTSTNLSALKGSFNAFTKDTSAYDTAVKGNEDLKNKLVASWQGPISQALSAKLISAFSDVTTAGEASIVGALNTTAAKLVDSGGNNLIAQVSARIGTKDSGLTASVQKVAAGISNQAKLTQDNTIPTITGKIDEVIKAINSKNSASSSSSSSAKKSSSSTSATKAKNTTSVEMGINGYLYKVTRDSKGKAVSALPLSSIAPPKFPGSMQYGGKARGSLSINKDDRYLTQEKGGEIITTKDGVLIPLKAGDGVVPAQLTEKLFEMARNYPDLPSASNVQIPNIPASGMRTNLTVSYGSLLTVNGNVDKEVLPSLKTILQESYQYTQKKLAQDAMKAGMRKTY